MLVAAVISAVLVLVNSALAVSGLLGDFQATPPPFVPFFLINVLGVSLAIAFSSLGRLLQRGLSYSALVGFHAFRLLAELVIITAVHERLAPVQMSLRGYNLDVLTGAAAVVLGLALRVRIRRLWLIAFNVLGLGCLAVIAFVAATSMPGPVRLFMTEPSNIWVSRFPYVLLPGILVTAAHTGHWILLRKLASDVSLARARNGLTR